MRGVAAALLLSCALPVPAADDATAQLSRLMLPESELAPAARPLSRTVEATVRGSQDTRLRAAAASWQDGEWREALSELDALIAAQPNFRAAHYLRARILEAHAGQPASIRKQREEELALLSEETRLRLAPSPHGIAHGLQPGNLLRLPEGIAHVIAVDLAAARLYVLARDGQRWRVEREHYAAMGSAGYGKEREGDLRTPVGVYRILSWLDGGDLPDLYGSGAFPVDYPNNWDRQLGRTGYGIWLHGVPSRAYTRLPRSSEGCVTLANAELSALGEVVTLGQTPVILADRLEWLSAERQQQRRQGFEAELQRWRQAWQQRDDDAYLAYYADDFIDQHGRDRAAFAAHKRTVNAAKQWVSVELRELAIYDYPGEQGLRLVRFEQRYASNNYASVSRKEQYWRRQADGSWRIERVFERDERPMSEEALRMARAEATERDG